jgi:RNA 2',3'-cyclic 3'-phosphodiesterase
LTGDPLPTPDPEERVRLFVALELPGAAREALSRWEARALHGVDRARAITPTDLHATLCFLGWRASGEIEAIRDACAVLRAYPAPELGLGEARSLPPRRPRVLAVELEDASGALARAQGALSEVLEAGGWYKPEKRAFLAHVTVARLGRGAQVHRRTLPDPPELTFRASRVSLYRSRLLRSGARYEPLASVELARPD